MNPVQPCPGVCHFSEIPFVFQVAPLLTGAEEAELARAMATYWTSFAATFSPQVAPPTPTPSSEASTGPPPHSPPLHVLGALVKWLYTTCTSLVLWCGRGQRTVLRPAAPPPHLPPTNPPA